VYIYIYLQPGRFPELRQILGLEKPKCSFFPSIFLQLPAALPEERRDPEAGPANRAPRALRPAQRNKAEHREPCRRVWSKPRPDCLPELWPFVAFGSCPRTAARNGMRTRLELSPVRRLHGERTRLQAPFVLMPGGNGCTRVGNAVVQTTTGSWVGTGTSAGFLLWPVPGPGVILLTLLSSSRAWLWRQSFPQKIAFQKLLTLQPASEGELGRLGSGTVSA